jgi:hypothetical protein
MSPKAAADASLKRLGGGRWQTRDERFTIEPQSGTWVVVDAEQTDDLGLPLVRGPFGSLGAAKEAIADARVAEPAVSPLAGRAPKRTAEPDAKTETGTTPASTRSREARTATPVDATDGSKRGRAKRPARPSPAEPEPEPQPEPEPEPRWITELEPDARRRARTLIDRLTTAGAPDPEGLARRDIVGDVPAVATFALIQALRDLGEDAGPAAVLEALADGRDRALGVRWRLVDGEGRRITLDPEALQPDE